MGTVALRLQPFESPFNKASNFDFDVALVCEEADRAFSGMKDLKGRNVADAALNYEH